MSRRNRKTGARSPSQPAVHRADDVHGVDEVEQGLRDIPEIPHEYLEDFSKGDVDGADSTEVTAARLRNAFNDAKQQSEAFKHARAKLSETQARLTDRESELNARALELDRRAATIAESERDLESQRLAAKAGFVDELREATREVSEELDALIVDAASWGADTKAKAVAAMKAESQRVDEDREMLVAEWSELRKRQAELRVKEGEVASHHEFLQAKESSLDSTVERRAAGKIRELEDRLDEVDATYEAEKARADKAANDLRHLRNELAKFGDDPEGLQRRIDELTEALRSKTDELSRRPPEEEVSQLRGQALRVSEAEGEAAHWRGLHDQIDLQLRHYLVNVGELEVLRDERDALAAQRETLRQAIAQQRIDWEELQTTEGSARPFPACSEYDEDAALARDAIGRDVDSLADLVDEMRQRMARNPSTSFYYSEIDVRLFLAGLASSRLHLLQGISGTGKTSLPREFFKALGGDAAFEIVEVQAGWRDKDDLFGYYNAFEKRFVESEFTKALYRALLPANADRPMVIVLDEMNLAHPEQYFAVMLSKLENSATEQVHLELLSSEVPHLPRLFDGSRLPLAANVWFVGTANHDETTVAFADKTYDRAHVQVLPANHVPFRPSSQGPAEPVSFEALTRAFKAAAHTHRKAATEVKRFLRTSMHEEFARLGVGWGNRLERQIDAFVPVVLEAGGGVTEAVDHLVATKLVRKLEDRFGVRPEDLDALADSIEILWDQLEPASNPSKTLEALHREANRIRGGIGS